MNWMELRDSVAPEQQVPDLEFAGAYLEHYGYLPPVTEKTFAVSLDTEYREALVGFQHFTGLDMTGKLDGPTLRLMHRPRCGCPDILRSTEDAQEAKWRKTPLNYWHGAFVSPLSQQEQVSLVAQAFASWAVVVNNNLLSFQPVASQANADLHVLTGRGRSQGFDGRGGTLAWAQLPPGNDQALTMRFDSDEVWTRELFLCVSAHEFGHLIGLDHSQQKTALMYPYANVNIPGPTQNDDIPRAQQLYGKPTSVPVPPVPPVDPPVPPPLPGRQWLMFSVPAGEVVIPGFRKE